jgi:hypothetical protein
MLNELMPWRELERCQNRATMITMRGAGEMMVVVVVVVVVVVYESLMIN